MSIQKRWIIYHDTVPVQGKNCSLVGISFITVGNVYTKYRKNADHALSFLVDACHVVVVPIQRRDSVEHCFQAVDAVHDEILVDLHLQITGDVPQCTDALGSLANL